MLKLNDGIIIDDFTDLYSSDDEDWSDNKDWLNDGIGIDDFTDVYSSDDEDWIMMGLYLSDGEDWKLTVP